MHPSQLAARALWIGAASLTAVHAIVTVGGVGSQDGWVGDGWGPLIVCAVATIMVFVRAWGCARRAAAWLVLGAGLVAYTGGQAWAMFVAPAPAGEASVPTVLWLCLPPAALAAILLRVRVAGVIMRREVWLDGLIGGCTVAAVGTTVVWEIVVAPFAGHEGAAAYVAFALADLVVVGFGVAMMALLGGRTPRTLVVLTAGFGALCVVDALYLAQTLRGEQLPVVDTAWMAAMLAIAAAAAWPRPRRTWRPSEARELIAMPLAFGTVAVLLATAMTLWGIGSHAALSAALTSLSLLAVVARCGITIREHRRAIAALRRAEDHLQQAQRHARLGSWEVDLETGSITWSAEMARLHGWTSATPPDAAGLFALVHEDDRDAVREAPEIAARTDGPHSVVYRLRDDPDRVIEARGVAVRSNGHGHATKLFGTCQDVSDRFARLEAERANQAKNEFLSRMSHELRTPLNAILGFGQLLAMDDLTDGQRGKADHVVCAGRHLLELVDEVLDIARIEAGELSLHLEPVELAPLVGAAVDLARPLAEARGIAVAADVGDVGWVRADPQRLRQVLLNLVGNAVKYNRDGGRVDVAVEAAGSGRVRVTVRDTGPGIAPELFPRLFVPFDRLGAERGGVEGTGLGLSLSRALAEAMGAALTVESTVGAGSTFAVELELADAPDRPAPPEPPPCAEEASLRRRVLCVEDNVSNLTLIEQLFAERPSIRLFTAMQGSIGVDLARRYQPELVLLDLNLPDMDGAEVLARLRADPATAATPVVVISADATRRRVEELLQAGATAYVTKPFDVQELLTVVDEALATAVPV